MCEKCSYDNNTLNMFSSQNKMSPSKAHYELSSLSMIEQQMISRISHCIIVHMFINPSHRLHVALWHIGLSICCGSGMEYLPVMHSFN